MNNERIKNWAHVAEIVSGIAVVVTLVFRVAKELELSDEQVSRYDALRGYKHGEC